ncbi:MAG TPA: polyprenyl diphosphate synthase [Parachlamydiaceae bacterium]|nr:polyprenyl diphosphate synthase [Parachlamydiaceae bacterium]
MQETPTAIFSPEQLAAINKSKIPRHVAIIPDGNRRWAKSQQEGSEKGHEAGAGTLIEIVKAGKALGIKALTFYLFSTENWTRPQEEVAALMWLLQEFLKEQCAEMVAEGVRLQTIGNLDALPQEVLTVLEETIAATAHCNQIDMILALNYGSRDEIRRAFHHIIDHYDAGKFQKEDVTEKLISSYLDTKPWGDPDLLIRTSGEMRVSNFLLWQLSYTEIYVTELLWPEFKPKDLFDAVADFQKRERRLGGT